jgi:NAD-dependent DNA ligase
MFISARAANAVTVVSGGGCCMTSKKYIALCLEMLRHCYLYYECDSPEIQDYEYDLKYRELCDYEESHKPVSFSPTQFVGFVHTHLEYEVENDQRP